MPAATAAEAAVAAPPQATLADIAFAWFRIFLWGVWDIIRLRNPFHRCLRRRLENEIGKTQDSDGKGDLCMSLAYLYADINKSEKVQYYFHQAKHHYVAAAAAAAAALPPPATAAGGGGEEEREEEEQERIPM